MNNIIDFGKARSKKIKQLALVVKGPKKQSLTTQEVFLMLYENTLEKWKENASKNCLSQYIESRLPKFARLNKTCDYLNDLNVLSQIEHRLSISVAVFSPNPEAINKETWLVGFHWGKEIFSAPPGMASEAHARALNILLWLSLEEYQTKNKL